MSIEDNIKIGRPSATYYEIVEAAKKANAHDFIESFGQGKLLFKVCPRASNQLSTFVILLSHDQRDTQFFTLLIIGYDTLVGDQGTVLVHA